LRSFAGFGGGANFVAGVLPCLAASLISGLAGAMSQVFMQSGSGRNASLYSMELSAFSFLTLAVSLLWSADGGDVVGSFWKLLAKPWTFLPIISNACGGIIVGQVTKHAGSVRKGFALILGIVLTGVVQAVLGGGGLTLNQKVGGGIVVLSMYMHQRFGGGGGGGGGKGAGKGGKGKEKPKPVEISVRGKGPKQLDAANKKNK
jgi:UDP-sugar transporter A1/2/3